MIFETDKPEKLKDDLLILKGILEETHAGTYAYNSQPTLDKLFDSINNTINRPLTKREFLDKVDFIVESIHCAHTDCYFPEKYFDTLTGRKYFFPIPLIRIEDNLYVNSNVYSIPAGSEVFLLNNHFVKEIYKKLLYHRHTDGLNTGNKDAAINNDFAYNYFIAFGPEKEFEIRYRNAETKEVEIRTINAEKLDNISLSKFDDMYYNFPTDFLYDLTILEPKSTAILTITSFDESSYSQKTAFFNFPENSFTLMRLKGTKNLVIDYRNNAGGYFNCSYKLLSYFISSPMRQFDSAVRRFNKLPYKKYVSKADSSMQMRIDSSYGSYLPKPNHNYMLKMPEIDTCFPADNLFKGKTYIITNGNVVSAAASSASLLKELAGATIVGEETGGGYAAFNSEILSYTLPNSGIRVDIPTIRYYPTVSKKENIHAVKPDHYIPLTIKDLLDFEDGPMKFILDSLIR